MNNSAEAKPNHNPIGDFVKKERKKAGLTQEEFAFRSGLSLSFVRNLEQGKKTLRLDKVNRALYMFGAEASPLSTSASNTPNVATTSVAEDGYYV